MIRRYNSLHIGVLARLSLLALLVLAASACGSRKTPAPDARATQEARILATVYPERTPTASPSEATGETAMPVKQWSQPPEMTIDPEKTYIATFRTEKGDVRVELWADKAPKTVNNFVFLAREGFYDNVTFHRVMPDFMAQGGDPTGTGRGGPGYQFEDEIIPGLVFDRPGLLAMANAGANTNGSQFFITYKEAPWLNGMHTIFGEVIEGMDVLLSLTPRDPRQNPTYPGDTLETVIIEEQ